MAGRKGIFIWYEDSEQFGLLQDAQLGQLIRALIDYSQNGARPELEDPAVAMAFSFMASRDDRDSLKYDSICEKRREAGKKGGRPKKANAFLDNQKVSEESKEKQKKPSSTPASTLAPALTSTPASIEACMGASAPTRTKAPKKDYGQYGWVKLSDGEYTKLLNDLGEAELLRCIAYIDESAQSTGNKNKWKDWNLVLRRCSREGWGVRVSQENAKGDVRYGSDQPNIQQSRTRTEDWCSGFHPADTEG